MVVQELRQECRAGVGWGGWGEDIVKRETPQACPHTD